MSVYSRFVELLNVSNSPELLKEVIMNFDVWARSCFLKIVNNWSQVLILSHAGLIAKSIPFHVLLARVAAFLELPDIDSQTFAPHFMHLLVVHHSVSRTPDAGIHVLSHIYRSKSYARIFSYLELLRNVGGSLDLEALHYLFLQTDSQLFCEALQTVLTLSEASAPEEIMVIMHIMTPGHINRELFDRIRELIPSYPVILVMAAMVAFSLQNGSCEQVRDLLLEAEEKSIKVVIQVKYWFHWPILAMLRLRDIEAANAIYRFYRQDRTRPTFDGIMCVCDAVELTKSFDAQNFTCSFLRLVCDHELGSTDDVNLLFQRCFRFLFTSFRPSTNLFSFFQASPFDIEVPVIEPKPESSFQKPILCLFGILETAFDLKIENLFFAPAIREDGFRQQQLVDSLTKLVKVRKLPLTAEFSWVHVFKHLRKRKTRTAQQRLEWLQRCNTELMPVVGATSILYRQGFRHSLQKTLSNMQKFLHRAEVAVSTKYSEYVYEITNELEKMEVDLRRYQNKFMNLNSIWPGFADPLQKSFRITEHLTAPFLTRPHISEAAAISVPEGVFNCRALLVKLAREIGCMFTIESDRVILERPRNLTEIKLSSVKSVCRKMKRGSFCAIEFITFTGKVYLIEFEAKVFGQVLRTFAVTCGLDVPTLTAQALSAQWRDGTLTAFDYLNKLNNHSGRSLRNREFYPIFPSPLFNDKVRNFEETPGSLIDTSVWTFYFQPFHPHLLQRFPGDEFLRTFQAKSELSIEFFTCFECFSGLPVPKFARSEFEFVYFLRSLLESDEIRDKLHLWTSKVFGCNEPRLPCPFMARNEATSLAIPEFRVGSFAKTIFTLVDLAGVVRTVDFRGEGRYWRLSAKIDHYLALQDYFVVIDLNASQMIYSVNGGDSFKEFRFEFVIASANVCGDSIVLWTEANELIVLMMPQIVCRIPIKTHLANCMFASVNYDRVVVGTFDSKLFIYSISGRRFLNSVDLGGKIAEKIIITKGFGFIVVSLVSKLAVYTINGVLISELDIDQTIYRWSQFVNNRGFDFLLVADDSGAISVFEVFNLKHSPAVFHCHTKIGVLGYADVMRGFAVATFDGSGYFVPYDPPETRPCFE
jgi:hypothetical protein